MDWAIETALEYLYIFQKKTSKITEGGKKETQAKENNEG